MDSEKKKIVVVGSINMDLVCYTSRIPAAGETTIGRDFKIHPGGKGANQAVAVARLGWPVRMIGRVGDDSFGQELRQHLREAGVDVSRVLSTSGSSGVAVILVSDSGENRIVITPGANALVTPADLDANLDWLRSAGLVLAQLEIPLETVEHLATLCAREGVPLMLDPAPAQELSGSLLQKVTWFTPNELEADFYIPNATGASADPPRIAEALLKEGFAGVVLKLGARGAYVLTSRDGGLNGSQGGGLNESQGGGASIAPFPVRAVDTTAAGDAFNGAFATGLLMGKGSTESGRFAAAAAALSVTRQGAQPSMPSLAEVETMLTSCDPRLHD